jgi:hypothetical protein
MHRPSSGGSAIDPQPEAQTSAKAGVMPAFGSKRGLGFEVERASVGAVERQLRHRLDVWWNGRFALDAEIRYPIQP